VQEAGFEVLAMVTVVDPFPGGGDPLTGGNRRRVADNSHEVPMSPRLGPQNAKAVLRIVEGDALDEACQRFLGSTVPWVASCGML
jgi:hypothetical protein